MGIERKPTRYAHAEGHTDVCYSEDGKMLITCGTDGDIRIWSGFEDDDPVQTCVGEWSQCVQQKGEQLMIATDNNNVQLVTFPGGERDGILTKFTAPVNHMAIGKNNNIIAIASEDMEVRVMTLDSLKEEQSVKTFEGLSGPPLSVAICPKAKMLAVSCGDGNLRIWDIESKTIEHEISCVPKVNSFSNAKNLCRIDFDPTYGKYLSYPDKSSVVVLNTSDWSVKYTFSCGAVEDDFTITQYSPCGNYLAAASTRGDIAVWNTISENLVDMTIHPKSTSICALVWNPQGNGELAFCDVNGQLGIAIKCNVDENHGDDPDLMNEMDIGDDIDMGDVGIDDDEDNENAVSLEKLKNDILGSPIKDDDERSVSISMPRSPRPRTPEVPLQAAFMPSSTPEHLNPRYLCWNEVGVVKCYGTPDDDQGKSIEVEFHDFNFHNSMMLQNFQNYTMGSISPACLAVANASQVSVIPLNASSKEWNVTVGDEEEIICISASSSIVCVATGNNLVRVFGIYGTQKSMFCVPGPLVTMAAFDNLCVLAYHNASARKNDQCIEMMLVNLEGLSVQCKNLKSALASESTLQWLGFTNTGNPASMDSYGMLCICPMKSGLWIPFCDTTKQKSSPLDNFFVTAVYESIGAVRGIKCRGSMYPGFTPRPTQMELKLQPPFLELSTQKSQMEANLFMCNNLQLENNDKEYKESALKSFSLACKSNLDQRAYELIELLGDKQVLNLALKYCSKLEKNRLAEKLIQMASKLDDHFDKTDVEEAMTPTSGMKPLSKKIVLSAKMLKHRSSSSSTPTASKNENLPSTPDATPLNCSDASFNLDSQESTTKSDVKNPFLKASNKESKSAYNPLSLTDKFAGYNVEKENKNTKEGTEKRKQPDTASDADKSKEKQRKLDRFMFAKKT